MRLHHSFRVAGCTALWRHFGDAASTPGNSPVSCSMAIMSCAAVAGRNLRATIPRSNSGWLCQVGTASVERVRKLRPSDRLAVLEGWYSFVPTDRCFTCYNPCVRYSQTKLEACRSEQGTTCVFHERGGREQTGVHRWPCEEIEYWGFLLSLYSRSRWLCLAHTGARSNTTMVGVCW